MTVRLPDVDLNHLAESFRLSVPTATARRVRAIAKWTREGGGRCALVGGPVRDLLLDIPNIDVDLAVEADVRALVRRAEDEWGCETRYFDAFETATLLFDDGTKVDLARTRTETYPHPGALPVVSPASLDDDLRRRDFTINTMALVLRADGFSQLLDPFDGRSDLERGVIRDLHKSSFIDDPTRIYRAARFAGRLGFSVEAQTKKRILAAVAAAAPAVVSRERLAREMRLILMDAYPARTLRHVVQLRAENFISPNLGRDQKPRSRLNRADLFVVRQRTVLDIDPLAMRAIALAWEWPRDAAREWLIQLGVPTGTANRLAADAARAPDVARDLHRLAWSKNDERLLVCDGLRDEALAVMAAMEPKPFQRRVARYWALRSLKIVHLNGDDLRAMGIPQGPRIGMALDALRRAVWRGEAGDDRESQRRWMEWRLR